MTDSTQTRPTDASTLQALNARLKTIVETQTAGRRTVLRGTAWDVDRTKGRQLGAQQSIGLRGLAALSDRVSYRELRARIEVELTHVYSSKEQPA